MKRLKIAKITGFCLITIAVVLVMLAGPAYAIAIPHPPASPSGEGGSSGTTMPPGYGNSSVQQAQTAAATAVQAPSPSNIEPSVSTTPVVKPGIETNALAAPLSSASKSLEANVMSSYLGGALRNKDSIGMDAAGDKAQLKGTSLKNTFVIDLNSAPISSMQTMNNEKNTNAQETAFEPTVSKYAPSKEEIKMIDDLKVVMNDLKQSDVSSNSLKAKELQDQLTRIADMMNSDQYNLNVPDRDAKYASVAYLFKGLDNQKMVLMMKYTKATEPYYDKVRDMLTKNIKIVQAVGGVAKQITEEDIKKMPRNEIDKLLEKLRKSADKTFETEYMLQQEAKYKKEYLEPNIKKLKDDMVEAIGGFTEKMSEAIK